MDEHHENQLLWVGFGGLAPVLTAMALVGLRGSMLNANVALILVSIVVVTAAGGGRAAGAAAAVGAALSFDFFHTQPYLQLQISSADDVETTLLLFAVGLIVGHIAASRRRAYRSANAGHHEISRIHRVAELAAQGEDAADVIMSAQTELTALLRLQECRFEAPPFTEPLTQLERSGTITSQLHRLQPGGLELPAEGLELPVLGRGNLLGRFVLRPTAGTGVSLEERVVAVALADQVGAVLAAPRPVAGPFLPAS